MGNSVEGMQPGKEPAAGDSDANVDVNSSPMDNPISSSSDNDDTSESKDNDVSETENSNRSECLNRESGANNASKRLEQPCDFDERVGDEILDEKSPNEGDGDVIESRVVDGKVSGDVKMRDVEILLSPRILTPDDDRRLSKESNVVNWRNSITSTVTDASESYQTACDDSDKDGCFINDDRCDTDQDDDVDDALATTLRASQFQEGSEAFIAVDEVTLTCTSTDDDMVGVIREAEESEHDDDDDDVDGVPSNGENNDNSVHLHATAGVAKMKDSEPGEQSVSGSSLSKHEELAGVGIAAGDSTETKEDFVTERAWIEDDLSISLNDLVPTLEITTDGSDVDSEQEKNRMAGQGELNPAVAEDSNMGILETAVQNVEDSDSLAAFAGEDTTTLISQDDVDGDNNSISNDKSDERGILLNSENNKIPGFERNVLSEFSDDDKELGKNLSTNLAEGADSDDGEDVKENELNLPSATVLDSCQHAYAFPVEAIREELEVKAEFVGKSDHFENVNIRMEARGLGDAVGSPSYEESGRDAGSLLHEGQENAFHTGDTAIELWRDLISKIEAAGSIQDEEFMTEEGAGDSENECIENVLDDLVSFQLSPDAMISTPASEEQSGSNEVVAGSAEFDAAVTAIAGRHLSWFDDIEEPEPDYSLSSDDEDNKPENIIDFSSLDHPQPTTQNGNLVESVSCQSPPPDYPASFVPSSASQGLSQIETFVVPFSTTVGTAAANSSTVVQSCAAEEAVDDVVVHQRAKSYGEPLENDEDGLPIGQFQRRTSMRPAQRHRFNSNKSKKPPSVLHSHSEQPDDGADQTEDSQSSESVFESVETPQPTKSRQGMLSDPKTLMRLSSSAPKETQNNRGDAAQSHKDRFEVWERKNATRSHKPDKTPDVSKQQSQKIAIVLRKDQGGFGFGLSSSSPIIIEKVHENGVADKGGIQRGDRINKVNGTLVSHCNHDEVNKIIKDSGQLVSLEILRGYTESTSPVGMPQKPANTLVASDPFSDLKLLKRKPAHLAVFLSYLLAEGNPSALFFSLINDYFQQTLREPHSSARRWAYEIFSTFLSSRAPLKLNIDVTTVASIEKKIQDTGQGRELELLNVFLPIESLARPTIAKQLKDFVTSKLSGQKTPYATSFNLHRVNMDRQMELHTIESALWKKFENCLIDEHNDMKRAIAYSLATLFRQVGYTGARNSSQLDSCPTFVSKDKKALKNKMKKHFEHKGHQFSPRQFASVTHCHVCQKVIWGLGHQAYECACCVMTIHRHCTDKLNDFCAGSRSRDYKRSVRDIIPGRRSQMGRGDGHRSTFPSSLFSQDEIRSRLPSEWFDTQQTNTLNTSESVSDVHSINRSPVVAVSDDSDLDVDSELPPLTDFISKEELRQMKDKERKKQQVINELFHIERLHVRALKVMDRILLRPMLEDLSIEREFISLLFPNLQELIQIHDNMNKEFLYVRKQKSVVDEIGQLLVSKFSGPHGDRFKAACAKFCADQAHALEVLRLKQKKEARLFTLLQDAAANPLSKRLELKDLLPRQMQQLTKYPLLIESLRKCVQTNTEEYGYLTEALKLSKELLEHVNQHVKLVQNKRHLSELQQRLDRKAIDSSEHPVLKQYRNLDLTQRVLVYDGEVTWRPFKSRPIEVHMVLFEDILVILQKQDDRLLLRCSSSTLNDEIKFRYCPIMNIDSVMARDVATDKRGFFVIDSGLTNPQVYEFLTQSRDEKNKWCNHIQETVKQHFARLGIPQTVPKVNERRLASKTINRTLPGSSPMSRPQRYDRSRSLVPSHDIQDLSVAGSAKRRSAVELLEDVSYDSDSRTEVEHGDEAAHQKETKARSLEELTSYVNRLIKENLRLQTGSEMAYSDDDDQFETRDRKELVNEALLHTELLKELVSEQCGEETAPESISTQEELISVPAETVVNYLAIIQQRIARLAVQVINDDLEKERLDEFQSTLDDLQAKASAGCLSTLSVPSSLSDESASLNSQQNIYEEAGREESAVMGDFHDPDANNPGSV